jgi:hypothetical protein
MDRGRVVAGRERERERERELRERKRERPFHTTLSAHLPHCVHVYFYEMIEGFLELLE